MNQLAPIPTAGPPLSRFAPPYGDATQAEERWITFADLLRTVKIHRRMILSVAAGAVGLASLAVLLMTPLYMGSALVMVDEQQSHVVDETSDPSVLSGLPSDPSSIASQVELLQSHQLAGEVVDKLDLVHDEEFAGKPGLFALISGWLKTAPPWLQWLDGTLAQDESPATAQKQRESVIDKFSHELDVYSLGHSTVIEIDFRSKSADKAARIANAIAGTYVQDQVAAKAAASARASQLLADRVDQLAHEAGAAAAAVQQYKVDHGILDTSTGTSLTDQQLGDLTTQLITAQSNEAESQAKLARMRQLVQSGHGADVSQVVDSPLITQLREQEATLIQTRAELSTRYGPLHPKMKDIEAQLRDLHAKIDDEVARVVGTVGNDAAVTEAQVGALKHQMENLSASTNDQNQARVKLSELEANATSASALYQATVERMKQTQQQASLKIPDVHVASPAAVPLKPSFPKTILIVGASLPAGLLLGFLIALMRDRICPGFRSAGELEAALGLPVLATTPELRSKGRAMKEVGLQVVNKPHSQFAESIRGLEVGLSLLANGGGAGKAVLVTSALPSEGKTVTATSLARRVALSGYRVVIVDADLRRPRVLSALGLRKPKYGLVDYLDGRCALDEALSPDPHSPLVALTASQTPDASSRIASRAMKSVIERLRTIADLVVIDSPPVLAVHDAKKLAPMTDGTLFVVRWEKTPREASGYAVRSLREFGVPIFGTALARADAEQYRYYTYGYTGVPQLAGYYEN